MISSKGGNEMTLAEAKKIVSGIPKDLVMINPYKPFPGRCMLELRTHKYGMNIPDIVDALLIIGKYIARSRKKCVKRTGKEKA